MCCHHNAPEALIWQTRTLLCRGISTVLFGFGMIIYRRLPLGRGFLVTQKSINGEKRGKAVKKGQKALKNL